MECICILAGGGGTVSNTEQSCVKTPGGTGACTVAFGLVAYKMIYHNSGLTVLKGVDCPVYTLTCFYIIDSPVGKVQYGTVTKQLLRP